MGKIKRPDLFNHNKGIKKSNNTENQLNEIISSVKAQTKVLSREDEIESLCVLLALILLRENLSSTHSLAWLTHLKWPDVQALYKQSRRKGLEWVKLLLPVHFQESRPEHFYTHFVCKSHVTRIIVRLHNLSPKKKDEAYCQYVIRPEYVTSDIDQINYRRSYVEELFNRIISTKKLRRLERDHLAYKYMVHRLPTGFLRSITQETLPTCPTPSCGISIGQCDPLEPLQDIVMDIGNIESQPIRHPAFHIPNQPEESEPTSITEWRHEQIQGLLEFKATVKQHFKKRPNDKTLSRFYPILEEFIQSHPLRKNAVTFYVIFWCWTMLEQKLVLTSTIVEKIPLIGKLLINLEGSHNIALWDQSSIDNAFLEIAKRKNKTSKAFSTISKHKGILTQFFLYLQNHDLLTDLTIPKFTEEQIYQPTAYRNYLIAPTQMLEFLERLCELDHFNYVRNAYLLIAFGYFGGLRSGEVLHLTLSSIHIPSLHQTLHSPGTQEVEELYITIKITKSQSGKRKIPLHVFAPQSIIKRCIQYYTKRQAGLSALDRPNNEKFLIGIDEGPNQSPSRYSSLYAIALLKKQFDTCMDLHTLRHNFASWTLLRFYSELPFVNQYLKHYAEAFMSSDQIAHIDQLLSWGTTAPREHRQNQLILLSELMGHANHETTLSTYVHTLAVLVRAFKEMNRLNE